MSVGHKTSKGSKHREREYESKDKSTLALVLDASKYFECAEVLHSDGSKADYSLTKRQHLKLFGEHSLLKQGMPVPEPVLKRETSKTHQIRVDADTVLKQGNTQYRKRGGGTVKHLVRDGVKV